MAVILEDTRQKIGKHDRKRAYFCSIGLEIVRKKLDFGDYMTENGSVSVDTKRDVSELVENVTREHERFSRGLRGARDAGLRLVVLVESPFVRDLDGLARSLNPVCLRCQRRRTGMCDPRSDASCGRYRRHPARMSTVARTVGTMARLSGAEFEFVSPSESGPRICELLGISSG